METIVCANHPSRRASLTCERCGSYACSDCAIDAPWGVSVCAPCKARGALCYPLQWERGNPWSPRCFVQSARAILSEAPTLFVPAVVEPAAPEPLPVSPPSRRPRRRVKADGIELAIGGVEVRVGADESARAIAAVIRALKAGS